MTPAGETTSHRGAGRRLGKYTLLRRIGRGGMAEVYLARSHGIDRIDKLVAVKLVSAHLAEEPAFVTMLQQEARIVTNLDHPNIAAVLDFAVCDGESFLVIEYVHGYSLYDVLRAAARHGGALPLGVAIGIACAIAKALHYAHDACDVEGRPLGIVHRDVSPSNVLLRYDGVVKVVDFGIAKATGVTGTTESGVLKGKCGYMAPEQCNALAVDRRTDVFALGIVLFELTTGLRLFAGRNDFEIMNRISRGDVVPPSTVRPDYPPALERIVLRALSQRPEDRHPDAASIQRELEALAREEKLDTSSLGLRQLLDELMGPRPHPALEMEPTTSGPRTDRTELAAPRSTAERARRRRLRLGFAGAVVGTAVLTVVVAQALASSPVGGASRREGSYATEHPEGGGSSVSAEVENTRAAPSAQAGARSGDASSRGSASRETSSSASREASRSAQGSAQPILDVPGSGSTKASAAAGPSSQRRRARNERERRGREGGRARSGSRSEGRSQVSSGGASAKAPRRPSRSLFPDGD